jgi:transposase-like protein
MGKHHDAAMKEQTLLAIKNGESVASVSANRGVSTPTIYAWLRGQAENTGTSSLEIAKLRRENQELKEIIGLFTLEKKRGEKNHGREAAYGSRNQ